jgi:hypothetical protein
MLKNVDKAPFPWFGGKSKAAPLVWQLLGDVPHYVEPFYGSGAVLLNRPHPANRPYFSETVNDLDGFVVNFWRAVQWFPVETAEAASWPVAEADKTARQVALLRWRDGALDRLAGDACWCDPVMAGWWAWAVSVQIGAFDGRQGWTADPVSGRLYRQPRGVTRQPGVARDLPHVGNNGQGVNHAGTREPGVIRDRPHVSGDGQGVNHPGTREPGVIRDRPHVGNNGQGVNHAGTREPGVLDPPTADHGRSALDTIDWGAAYHDLTMPELVRWFRHLAARLRHVRILNGDWSRLVTTGAAWHLPVRQGKGPAGVFLDPPYADTAGRSDSLYAADSFSVAHDVRDWCLKNGDHPNWRIVLAGFDGEHGTALVDAGWTEHEWFTAGHLTGGMGNVGGKGNHQQNRERLWSSPHCLPVGSLEESDEQGALF